MVPSRQHPIAERLMPRFSGEDTFMKLPRYRSENPTSIIVAGAPFDGGTTYRPGARMGPKALRHASWGLYPYHRQRAFFLTERTSVSDAGDLFVNPMSVENSLESIVNALDALPIGTRVLLLGGDHSISLAPLRVIRQKSGPLALIHLDAHTDMWDEFWGSRYNHATVIRRSVDEQLIDPAHSIQIGIRGSLDNSSEDHYGEELGITQISTDHWMDRGTSWVLQQIHSRVGRRPAYISCDIDVVDPAYAPGTGTPEAGGPTSYMVLSVLRGLHCHVLGADVVELAPDLDHTGNSALFAASLAYELLFCMAADDDSGILNKEMT